MHALREREKEREREREREGEKEREKRGVTTIGKSAKQIFV